MIKISTIILPFICLVNLIYAQEKIELKKADKLEGRTENNQTIREATGNVHFLHNNIEIYCNNAIQYVEQNRIELKGNVRIFKDTLSLFTERAYYFGNDAKAICENGITLKDPNATLRADRGIYYFNEYKAHFTGDVIIVNPEYKITAKELIYFRNTEDSFCKGNVVVRTDSSIVKAEYIDFFKRTGKTFARVNVSIEKDSSIILSDTLTDYSFENKSIATGNVRINDLKTGMFAKGDYLENYENTLYTLIKGNAVLIRPEKSGDTLYLYSNMLEAFRKKPEYYFAKDSVNIIRGDFLAKCNISRYYTSVTDSIDVITLTGNPIVWQKDIQMVADSIYAEVVENRIRKVYAKRLPQIKNSRFSFIISLSDSNFSDRYDQIKGNNIIMTFDGNKLNTVFVDSNAVGIYYSYEGKKANGINFIDGEFMTIIFDSNQKVKKVKIEKNPNGKYVPEILINSVERFLPEFTLYEDKPRKR
ncbi:MAG: hypothetical protein N2490_07325 [Ignavibacteria bacterium]|nr:hypothetical protein [Ignavibacteria bacterium]